MTQAPVSTGRLYRLFWRWHFYAALLVVPFVLWQGITGTLYLWSGLWVDWQHPELRFVEPLGAPASLSEQVGAALSGAADSPVLEILVPEGANRSTTVVLQRGDRLVEPVFVNPYGAQLLGQLGAAAWMPGITRSLHGGWPLGQAGSWLLELGDCWAIVMIATGLYLWWPRKISWLRALWPRSGAGARVFWRDLHACVAVWFSLLILSFLVTALPWTAFWGGQILTPVQQRLAQENPAGFSPGGAAGGLLVEALPAADRAIAEARARGVVGTLQLRLGAMPESDWWIHNLDSPPGLDRYLMADRYAGTITTDIHGRENPLMARAIDAGVHLHQGDYGAINRWGNTAVSVALVWMSLTGLVSWWLRRPRGTGLAAPTAVDVRWPRALIAGAVLLCLLLPLLGASVLVLLMLDPLLSVAGRRGAWRT